jgi:hypothetical protein
MSADLAGYAEQTREAWLARVALGMRPKFESVGAPLPPRIRITMSLTKRSKVIGTCFDPSCSADGATEILVRLDRFDPLVVAAILAHELIHAAVGCAAGHGKAFRRVMSAIGLEGKPTATTSGPVFAGWVAGVLSSVGPFPHAALNFGGVRSGPKTQRGRMLKAMCDECGYVVRVTRVWLENVGPPICPLHDAMSVDEGRSK